MSRGAQRQLIPLTFADLTTWPKPDETIFHEDIKRRYSGRKLAIELYAAGESFSEIFRRCGVREKEVRRLLKRCLLASDDGGIVGFRAIVKNVRLKDYYRSANVVHARHMGSGGCSGALGQLFTRFPEVEVLIKERFLKLSTDIVDEARIRFIDLHQVFTKRLRELGLGDDDWPFCTANIGYNALRTYCHNLYSTDRGRWIAVRLGKDAVRRNSVGNGETPLISPIRHFTHFSLDFHTVDAASIITVINSYGEEFDVHIKRWYIGVLLCDKPTLITGIHVVLELQPSGDDTLETVWSGLIPETYADDDSRITFVKDGKVLPNQLNPALAYQGFSVVRVDNAWANAATEVITNIILVTGCAFGFGPIRAWWIRPFIERVFGELTARGLQRLPSTYGCAPKDTKRDGPDVKAAKFRIRLSELSGILHSCVREFNEHRSEGLEFSSPMDAIASAIVNSKSGFLPQTIANDAGQIPRLLLKKKTVVLRGNIKKNIAPYVQVDRCRYTNPRLSRAHHLLGRQLLMSMHRKDLDISFLSCPETGEDFGLLVPEKRWRASPLSVRERVLLNRSGLAKRFSEQGRDSVADWGKRKKSEMRAKKEKGALSKVSPAQGLAIAKAALRKSREKKQQGPLHEVAPIAKVPPKDVFGIGRLPGFMLDRRGVKK